MSQPTATRPPSSGGDPQRQQQPTGWGIWHVHVECIVEAEAAMELAVLAPSQQEARRVARRVADDSSLAEVALEDARTEVHVGRVLKPSTDALQDLIQRLAREEPRTAYDWDEELHVADLPGGMGHLPEAVQAVMRQWSGRRELLPLLRTYLEALPPTDRDLEAQGQLVLPDTTTPQEISGEVHT